MKKTVIAAISLLAALSAQATPLTGTSIQSLLSLTGSGVLDNSTATVGSGVEFTVLGGTGANITADWTDSTLTLNLFSGGQPNIGGDFNWTFTLLPGLTFLAIIEASDTFTSGTGASVVSVAGNVVTFQIKNQALAPSTNYTAGYALTVSGSPTGGGGGTGGDIPEPTSLALVGAALAAAGLATRRAQA